MTSLKIATRAPSRHTTTLTVRRSGRPHYGVRTGGGLASVRPVSRGSISMGGGAR